ncbi:MAG: hypothetical protein JXR29_00475 [Methylothermaceae bacterium]|nr:hypothetical protein [Methylothermaceae bacterium]
MGRCCLLLIAKEVSLGRGREQVGSILVGAILLLSGCSLPVRGPAVPSALSNDAEVVGMPGVRYVVREEMPAFARDAIESYYRELVDFTEQGHVPPLPPANFLAFSGVRDKGSFGVGLLCGWTVACICTEFKVVTGISTGALIAPFALIQTQGIGDLYKIYLEAQRDGIDFNLAYIPKGFNVPHKENFDTEYMRKMFQTGYELAAEGYRWKKTPPGL